MGTKQNTGTWRNVIVAVACTCALSTPGCGEDNEPSNIASCGSDAASLGAPADLVWDVSEPCVTDGDKTVCPESATFVWSADQGVRRLVTGGGHSQSPDGTWIATVLNDGPWSVVSAVDGTRHTIPGEPIAWSADSRRATVVGRDTQRLSAIDLATGDTLHTFTAEYYNSSIAIGPRADFVSPDGEWLATFLRRASTDGNGFPLPGQPHDVMAFARLDGTEVREVPLIDPTTGNRLPFFLLTGWTSDSKYFVAAGLYYGPVPVGDMIFGLEEQSVINLTRDPGYGAQTTGSLAHAVVSPVRPELAVVRPDGAIDIRDADGSSSRQLVAPVVLNDVGTVDQPRLQNLSHDGALLAYQATGNPMIRVVDTSNGAVVARAGSVDLTFDGWLATGGTEFSRASAPNELVHEAPTASWTWVRGDRYAYIENNRVHVASIDGSNDQVIWELSNCGAVPDATINLVPQRTRVGW